MSSGVSRGDMSGSQSVEASGLVFRGQWDVNCVLVFGPDREGRATLEVLFIWESSNEWQASGFQNGTRGSSCPSTGETSAARRVDPREMFQSFQAWVFCPDLEMSDRDWVRDGDEVRLEEGAQTVLGALGWSDAPEDPCRPN